VASVHEVISRRFRRFVEEHAETGDVDLTPYSPAAISHKRRRELPSNHCGISSAVDCPLIFSQLPVSRW
jgi:hypothetical protein